MANRSNGDGHSSFTVLGTRFDVDPRYEIQKALGHGAYGVVVSALDHVRGETVAIKKITKAFYNVNHTKRTLREVSILSRLSHDNVLGILGIMEPKSYQEFEDVYVVFEQMDTDLHQIITSEQVLSEQHMQFIIYQVLRGLKYIHSANVVHRDMKPSNLLINADCALKICDFGLSRVLCAQAEQKNLTEYVATRWYRAPEVLLSFKEYTNAMDVWSVGCILAEVIRRKPLFPGRDFNDQLGRIIHCLGKPTEEDMEFISSKDAKEYIRRFPDHEGVPFAQLFPNISPAGVDLLERMLTFSPDKRISVEDALSHPFFEMLHDPHDEPQAEFTFDVSYDQLPSQVDQLKGMLWNVACHFNPNMQPVDIEQSRQQGFGLNANYNNNVNGFQSNQDNNGLYFNNNTNGQPHEPHQQHQHHGEMELEMESGHEESSDQKMGVDTPLFDNSYVNDQGGGSFGFFDTSGTGSMMDMGSGDITQQHNHFINQHGNSEPYGGI